MPQIRSTIIVTGNESPREMAQKIADIQRQMDNRLSALENKTADHENRISELED
jgi:hypothetical protein